ncbi:MAG: hypothetical protein ACM3X3_09020 [Betaproteobacteria bacterium]
MARTDIDVATEVTLAWLNALATSGQGYFLSILGQNADKQTETVCKFFKAVKRAAYENLPDRPPVTTVGR